MKRLLVALAAIVAGLLAYGSLPLTSVALLTVTVTDQDNRKITSGATATYLDRDGATITEITSKTRGSWDNNLHWWAHSSHASSRLRPADAMRAVSVLVAAPGCEPVTVAVSTKRKYEPLSFSLHGGGPAYFILEFRQAVVLHCAARAQQ